VIQGRAGHQKVARLMDGLRIRPGKLLATGRITRSGQEPLA
jgi:hypothetical protein